VHRSECDVSVARHLTTLCGTACFHAPHDGWPQVKSGVIRGTSRLFRVTESISKRNQLFGGAHLASGPSLEWDDLSLDPNLAMDLRAVRLGWAVPKVLAASP
jgi:hypothetical protein